MPIWKLIFLCHRHADREVKIKVDAARFHSEGINVKDIDKNIY